MFRPERKKRSTSEGNPQCPNEISGKLPYRLPSNRNFLFFGQMVSTLYLPKFVEKKERNLFSDRPLARVDDICFY